jgi:anti-anti-sigma factor
MPEPKVTIQVRPVNGIASIIDIAGDLTSQAELVLMKAYTSMPGAHVIILNFSTMEYMNSSGIGLIVTLLTRANRQKQRLFAYGLSDHYQNIFQLTRLTDIIQLYASEAEAVKALRLVPAVARSLSGASRKRDNR